MNISDIEKIERSIENIDKLINLDLNLLNSSDFYIDTDYDTGVSLSIVNMLYFINNSQLIKNISTNNNTLKQLFSELKKQTDTISDEIDNEHEDRKTSIKYLTIEKENKKEELKTAINKFIIHNDFSFDTIVKIGKPNNPNEQKYKKEEFENFLLELVDILNNNNCKAILLERNKIAICSNKINNKIIDFVYNLVKNLELVTSKFSGTNFKGNIQITDYVIKSSNELKKLMRKL